MHESGLDFADCHECNNLRIFVTAPFGTVADVSSIPNLQVTITGYNSADFHWHWQVGTAFPASGTAGGNMVTSGNSAVLNGTNGITSPGTHIVYVALVDSNHQILSPANGDQTEIIVGPTRFVEGNVPNWQQPYFYENTGNITANYISNNPTLFTNWCSPTSAACQLGHLNHYYHSLVLPEKSSGHKDGISDLIEFQVQL